MLNIIAGATSDCANGFLPELFPHSLPDDFRRELRPARGERPPMCGHYSTVEPVMKLRRVAVFGSD